MKFFAIAAVAAAAPNNQQWQGENLQGNSWSAQAGPAGVAYQENGFSLVASPSAVTSASSGISTYCFDGTNVCQSSLTPYTNYSFDSSSGNLYADGEDNGGVFTLSGNRNSDGGMDLAKVYSSGAFAGTTFNIVSEEQPTDANYFFSKFTVTSDHPMLRSGHGRFAAAFVESVQVQAPSA